MQSPTSPAAEANTSQTSTHAPTSPFSPVPPAQSPPPDVESSGWDYPQQRPISLVPSALPSASSPLPDLIAPQGRPSSAQRLSEPASQDAWSSTGGASDDRERMSRAARGAGATTSGRPAASPAALRLSSASPSALVSSLRPTGGVSPSLSPAAAGDGKAEEERKRRAEEKRALFLQQQS